MASLATLLFNLGWVLLVLGALWQPPPVDPWSMPLDRRTLDTLFALALLFGAAQAARLALAGTPRPRWRAPPPAFMTRVGTAALVPLLLLMGLSVLTRADLDVGGGLQGGLILAVAHGLTRLVQPQPMFSQNALISIEVMAGLLLIGGAGGLWGWWNLSDLFPWADWPAAARLLALAAGLKMGMELAEVLALLAGRPRAAREDR